MPAIAFKKNKSTNLSIHVDKKMRDYSEEPAFVKKAKKAAAFLKANGLPKSFRKKK